MRITSKKPAFVNRKLLGECDGDTLTDGSRVVYKFWRMWWEDDSSCLKIIKYIRFPEPRWMPGIKRHVKEQCFYPTEQLLISWHISGPWLGMMGRRGWSPPD